MTEKKTKPPGHESLAEALAAAQLEMENPERDSTNPHFKSRYASLTALRNATVPVLARHGIAVIQDIGTDEQGAITCTVRLLWRDQAVMACTLAAAPERKGPQAVGSVVTYLRRYTLAAVAGVAPDEDDDGNAGTAKAEERTRSARGGYGRESGKGRPGDQPQASGSNGHASPKQVALLWAMLKKAYNEFTPEGAVPGTTSQTWQDIEDGVRSKIRPLEDGGEARPLDIALFNGIKARFAAAGLLED